MQIVGEVVGPDATRVLVEAHGPQAHDLCLWVRVELRQGFDAVERHAGFVCRPLQGIARDERCELIERDVGRGADLVLAGRLHLQRMLRPQTVTDVGLTQLEDRMLGDKVLVDAIGLDDVVGDGVEDDEIRLWFEHHRDVGQLERAMLECGQHGHLDMRI